MEPAPLIPLISGGPLGTVTYPYSPPISPTPVIAVDGSGNAYLGADIYGNDFPVTLPLPTQISAGYIAKIGASAGGLIIADPAVINFDNYIYSGEAI